MTISISRTALLTRLQQVSKIIQAKSATPILCHFLFETREGRLFITGSNCEGRITTSMECIFDEEITICVPTTIVEGLKTLTEQPLDMIINPVTREIRVNYHGGKFEVAGYDPVTYPGKKKIDALDTIRISARDFYYGISKVIGQAGQDDLRPIMTSVFMETTQDSLYFVATDGHRLGFLKRRDEARAKVSVVISLPIASVLKGIIPEADEQLEIVVGGSWSGITYGDIDVSFRNQEGKYPNWKSVIPQSNTIELVVDTRQLAGAIKRTSVFSNKVSCLVALRMSEGNLNVSAQDIDFSTSAEENLGVEFHGREFRIGLKGSFLLEILSCIDSDRVRMTFLDPSRAMLVMPEKQDEGEELTYLLMPMSINY